MKVGIVGAGYMGTMHAAAWAATGATLVGVVAEGMDDASRLAGQYGARGYPSYEALLAEVEVVDLCTPTHLHHAQTLQAAAAGKHIVCEKPLARTVEQGQAMIAACQAAGVKLYVAHVVRFFPEYARAKAAVDAGQIGRPAILRLVRASLRPKKRTGDWLNDEAKSGGMLLDFMIHDFDYARWVAGEVESVFAKTVHHTRPEASVDYGLVILKHAGGALSHVTGSWAHPPPMFRTRLEIAGDAGLIESDSAAAAPIEALLRPVTAGSLPEIGLPSSPLSESPYTTQIKAFYAAMTHDQPVPVSAADGLAAVQIALAATESAKTGRAIRLDRLPEVGP